MEIIIKGGPTHRPFKKGFESISKDELHRKRKELEGSLKTTIFSKDKMWQMDCRTKDDEVKRVQDYDKWKETKSSGTTNNEKMTQWSELNREFKRRNLEGREHSVDDIRARKNVKYD